MTNVNLVDVKGFTPMTPAPKNLLGESFRFGCGRFIMESMCVCREKD